MERKFKSLSDHLRVSPRPEAWSRLESELHPQSVRGSIGRWIPYMMAACLLAALLLIPGMNQSTTDAMTAQADYRVEILSLDTHSGNLSPADLQLAYRKLGIH